MGHIAVAAAAARAWHPKDAARGALLRTWLVLSAISMLPDLDVVAFALGIPYEHPLGHRGATHSFAFALAGGLVALALAKPLRLPGRKTFAYVTLILASHAVLDCFTNGGLGCELLWPFSTARYFAPWGVIPVAPIGLGMVSLRGFLTLFIETVMFAPLFFYATFPRKRVAS